MYQDKKTLFEQKYDTLMSFLGAHPSDKNFTNKIYAIANKDIKIKKTTILGRSEKIGFSQFYIIYHKNINEKNYDVDSKYIRVETNFFQNKLSIFANKTVGLLYSDILIFGDEEFTYISEGPHKWLSDDKYYRIVETNMIFGKTVLYEYDVLKLLQDEKIKLIQKDNIDQCTKVMTGSLVKPNITKINNLFVKSTKEYCMIENLLVQNDPRVGKPVYFCYYGSRYTNRIGTVKKIALELVDSFMPSANLKNVMQTLYRACRETDNKKVAIPAVFKLTNEEVNNIKNNFMIDNSILYEDKIVVFFSKNPYFDVIENKKILKTENTKEYQKEYQKTEGGQNNKLRAKIRNWLKRHNNEFNPVWTDEEKNIAQTILAKK